MSYDGNTQYTQAQTEIDGMTEQIAVLDLFIGEQKARHAAWAAAWLVAVRSGPGNGIAEHVALAGIIGPLHAAVKDRSRIVAGMTNAVESLAKAQAAAGDMGG